MNKYNILGFIVYCFGFFLLSSGGTNNNILEFVWGLISFTVGIILILKDDKVSQSEEDTKGDSK